jgi:hypothetical protein
MVTKYRRKMVIYGNFQQQNSFNKNIYLLLKMVTKIIVFEKMVMKLS